MTNINPTSEYTIGKMVNKTDPHQMETSEVLSSKYKIIVSGQDLLRLYPNSKTFEQYLQFDAYNHLAPRGIKENDIIGIYEKVNGKKPNLVFKRTLVVDRNTLSDNYSPINNQLSKNDNQSMVSFYQNVVSKLESQLLSMDINHKNELRAILDEKTALQNRLLEKEQNIADLKTDKKLQERDIEYFKAQIEQLKQELKEAETYIGKAEKTLNDSNGMNQVMSLLTTFAPAINNFVTHKFAPPPMANNIVNAPNNPDIQQQQQQAYQGQQFMAQNGSNQLNDDDYDDNLDREFSGAN